MTNSLEPNDLSHLTDEEFHALCPQGEHAPGPEPLSPAAQAVMIAATNGNTNVVNDPVYRQCIAAALRAAADQVITKNRLAELDDERSAEARLLLTWARDQFKAIAAELEARHD